MKKETFIIIFLSVIILNILDRRIEIFSLNENLLKEIFLFFFTPLILYFFMEKNLRNLGFTLMSKRSLFYVLLLLLISLPISFYASKIQEFNIYYPIWNEEATSNFLLYQLKIAILMFCTEFFYRGFLMLPLKEDIGRWSILLQSIPYTVVHVGKPSLEVPYSFFAGLIFGYLDYKEDSILPSFLVHWIGSAIFEWLCL